MTNMVRVFLPTFRRHNLLRRALLSLQAQTFTDWRCEVHNDDPADNFPAQLVRETGDSRIAVVNHPERLGGAAAMNAFYAPAAGGFISILEDDNWWEPPFLSCMLEAAGRHPHVSVFWANMRIWQEQKDGSFVPTGRTIYPEGGPASYEEFWWPDRRQAFGAVHSNGACLIRARPDGDYRIPAVPFAGIEMFRERTFPQPLLLVREPLANFSVTLESERARDGTAWGEATAVLGATFFRHIDWSAESFREFFEEGRQRRPPANHTLFSAALLEPRARIFLRLASWKEIFIWLLSLIRRPVFAARLLLSRKLHPEWWCFLEEKTVDRFAEVRGRGGRP
jgi:hypothetical protein